MFQLQPVLLSSVCTALSHLQGFLFLIFIFLVEGREMGEWVVGGWGVGWERGNSVCGGLELLLTWFFMFILLRARPLALQVWAPAMCPAFWV